MKTMNSSPSTNLSAVFGDACFDALFHSLLKANPEQAPTGCAPKPEGRDIHDSFMNIPG
jgi:hypothetical protein